MIRARGVPTDEESRANLQSRLAAFCKMMFWAYLAILAFLFATYAAYPDIQPRNQKYIYGEATVALALLALTWRVALLRFPNLSLRTLNAIDLIIAGGAGTAFGLSAYLAWDLHASAYTCLVYAAYSVFTRALLVPSTGWRTLVVSSISFLPVTVAGIGLWVHGGLEIPGRVFFVGDVLLSAVAVTLAAIGSRIIYGLRRQVTAAQQLGRYTLDDKIGEGGMGAVYRAHHVLLRRPTAVKLLLPDKIGADNLERFEREVQLMSQLTHPNTVAVFDYGIADGVFYYAMEYLGGGIDLANLVKKHGAQPNGRVIHVLAQVCGALQEAHDHNLIHRDIKPANIILCERGGIPDVAKVVDFGLVKELTPDTGASTQIVLGTPGFIAPEALTDPSRVGPGVDLYALGCVGYFMLTSKRVFEAKTDVDMCIQHVTATPRPPSELTTARIDPALEAIVLRCLAKKPEERYASARELAEALRTLAAQQDWSDADARSWWTTFRATEANVAKASSMPTRTLTVDIVQRETSS